MHRPVLLEEVMSFLSCVEPQNQLVFLDGTVGSGGYTEAILQRFNPSLVVGIDKDNSAIERTSQRLSNYLENGKLLLLHEDFRNFDKVFEGLNLKVAGAVLDLGVSSEQLEDPERGFSFIRNGPLDMRMDRRSKKTAFDLVNSLSEKELADIFYTYGEEPNARKIANLIVKERKKKALLTTADLVAIINRVVPKKHRIHPATKVFQALRIAVNDELGALFGFLEKILDYMLPGGVLCIVSFHSLEDRLVKRTFSEWSKACICPPGSSRCECSGKPKVMLLTKKAVKPSEEEVAKNPRARSARLRAVKKL